MYLEVPEIFEEPASIRIPDIKTTSSKFQLFECVLKCVSQWQQIARVVLLVAASVARWGGLNASPLLPLTVVF